MLEKEKLLDEYEFNHYHIIYVYDEKMGSTLNMWVNNFEIKLIKWLINIKRLKLDCHNITLNKFFKIILTRD